jgi:lantibiotic biosynthesis protein
MRRILSRRSSADMSYDDAFLSTAASIGRRIVTDAVWYHHRCSWVGAVDIKQSWPTLYRALEPNVYDGTAGVGLFLAQLAAVTGDAAARRTAIGAMRQSIARAPAIPPGRRDGFHAGSLGIAWAAARAGSLLGEEELHAGARTVLAVVPASAADRRPDVLPGGAGSVIALLALADAFDAPALVQDAVATGEELIARATRNRHGWSWAIPGRRYPHHLCGLSHGAAGIGWALLELFAATRDDRFGAAARGAFQYERSWLDIGSGTWPDLRAPGQRRGAARWTAAPTVGTWCHGEGGIALTRLRAVEVLEDEACAQDAAIALETTHRDLAGRLRHEIEDLTLCHGAAGSADVLLCGAAALGEGWHDAAAIADELGWVALERHDGTDTDWPCGVVGGTTPSLFQGLSGIAWWLLRLHDRGIPSPLTLPVRFDNCARSDVHSVC